MVLLLLSCVCVLYLACFHPFIEQPRHDSSSRSELQQVLSAEIHNIKAQIAHNIQLEAKQCLFSDNIMVFNDVYLTDRLAGSFYAKKITWSVGSDHVVCTGIIEGLLHEKNISVQSQTATYNIKSSILQWNEMTQWSAEPT